jgi:hypothetical protein
LGVDLGPGVGAFIFGLTAQDQLLTRNDLDFLLQVERQPLANKGRSRDHVSRRLAREGRDIAESFVGRMPDALLTVVELTIDLS